MYVVQYVLSVPLVYTVCHWCDPKKTHTIFSGIIPPSSVVVVVAACRLNVQSQKSMSSIHEAESQPNLTNRRWRVLRNAASEQRATMDRELECDWRFHHAFHPRRLEPRTMEGAWRNADTLYSSFFAYLPEKQNTESRLGSKVGTIATSSSGGGDQMRMAEPSGRKHLIFDLNTWVS